MANGTPRRTPGRVMSFDVSSKCVGFGVFDKGRLADHGKYRIPGKEHGERLAYFREWLFDEFRSRKPENIVVEAPWAGRRRFAFGVLMMYLGVLLAVHYEWVGEELPDENKIQPSVVKRVVKVPAGKTYEQRKRYMVTHINRLYDLDLKYSATDKTKKISDDDVADGIALGRAWLIKNCPEIMGAASDA